MLKSLVYNKFLNSVLNNNINLTEDEFKIALLTEDYTPLESDYSFFQLQLQGYEVSGQGYSEGGIGIIFKKKPYEQGDTVVEFSSANVLTWNNASFTAKYAIIYRIDDGLLVSCYDFGSNQTVDEGTFQIDWKSNSILKILLSVYDPQEELIIIDDVLKEDSPNPISNRAITQALQNFGVRIDGKDPYPIETWDDPIDTVDNIPDETIKRIIDDTTEEE